MQLEEQAKKHFEKLTQSLEYHTKRLSDPNIASGIKFQIQREVDALEFVIEYAKEALSQRGIKV